MTRSPLETVLPEGWPRPRGYANGILAPAGARLLFIAGQVGWDETETVVGEDFVVQFEQALRNVVAVIVAAGGSREDLVRLTLYVTDRRDYLNRLKEVGEAYRRIMGAHYPAMALLEVSALLEAGAKVEIEGTAALTNGIAAAMEEESWS